MDLSEKIQIYAERVSQALSVYLPSDTVSPEYLHEAMRYSVLAEGKRVRPTLVYATGEAFGVSLEEMDAPAAAVEIIHAYSLIHDDLPAMDDDDLRRGRPTCHKAYDEATAILAGDALQALAFYVIGNDEKLQINDKQKLDMITRLALASGSIGMAGGQAIDLGSVGKKLDLESLQNMHEKKTGALIRVSTELGALSSPNPDPAKLDAVIEYSKCIGLAFQVKDDILDIESDTETLGKPQGSDMEQDKPTYPELLGLDGAKKVAQELLTKSLAHLEVFDEGADTLREIAKYIVNRKK